MPLDEDDDRLLFLLELDSLELCLDRFSEDFLELDLELELFSGLISEEGVCCVGGGDVATGEFKLEVLTEVPVGVCGVLCGTCPGETGTFVSGLEVSESISLTSELAGFPGALDW